MSLLTHEQIMSDLAGLLQNFEGREYSGEIGADTLFFADLGLASIDAVVLGEKVETHYGRKIPFNEFLADLGRREVRDVRIGELADFLFHRLDRDESEG